MEQHSVPQHIASFEFKLFGNLTVRQFVTLAIPMGIAALIFFSNLATVIKLPLALVFGLFGIFAALVPIGGRPLDKWAVAFVKAILSPTQRIWIKEPKLPEFLSVVTSMSTTKEQVPEAITSQSRQRLLAYLRSLPKEAKTSLDVQEQVSLGRLELSGLSSGVLSEAKGVQEGQLPPPIIWPSQTYPQTPVYYGESLPQMNTPTGYLGLVGTPQAEVQYIGKMEESLPPTTRVREAAAPQAKISAHAKPFALPGLETRLRTQVPSEHIELIKTSPVIVPKARLASATDLAQELLIPITIEKRIRFIPVVGRTRVRKLHFAPPLGFNLAKLPIRGERRFEISEELKKRYEVDESLFAEPSQTAQVAPLPASQIPVEPQVAPPKIIKTKPKAMGVPRADRFVPRPYYSLQTPQDVTFKPREKEISDSKISIGVQKSSNIPLSSVVLQRAQIVPLTNRPNVLSGLALAKDGSPVEGAIIIVRDQNGIPVRAMKTNKLGQFLSATSLADGQYTLEIESKLANFEPLPLTLKGQIMAPLEIKEKEG